MSTSSVGASDICLDDDLSSLASAYQDSESGPIGGNTSARVSISDENLIQISDDHSNPPRYSQAVSEGGSRVSLIDHDEEEQRRVGPDDLLSAESLLSNPDNPLLPSSGNGCSPSPFFQVIQEHDDPDGTNRSARIRSLIPPDLKLVRTAEVVIMPKPKDRILSPTRLNQVSPVTSLSPSPVNDNAGYLNNETRDATSGEDGPYPASASNKRRGPSPSFRLEPIEEGRRD